VRPSSALESLRAQVRQIEGRHRRAASVLPFGLSDMDSRLPAGGLALGALHEVAGGGNGAIDGAAAALFAAGIAARTCGKVLWCITRPDLFAPALAQAGLKFDRVIYLEGGDDKSVLACFEEGLRHGGLGAVVAEVARLPMSASRLLQLAAEVARSASHFDGGAARPKRLISASRPPPSRAGASRRSPPLLCRSRVSDGPAG
jgi:protein ImuA